MKPTNVARGAVFLLAGFIGLGSSVGLLGAEEGSKAANRSSETAIPAKDPAALERIIARTDGKSSVVRLDGSGLGEAKAFFADPLRFVIDLPGAQGVVKAPRIEGKSPVQKIRVGRHAGAASKVRIVLDLRGPSAVEEIARTASSIELRVTRDARSRYAKAESAPVTEARAPEAVAPSAPEKIEKTEGTDAKPAEASVTGGAAQAAVQPSVGAEGEKTGLGASDKAQTASALKSSDISIDPAKASGTGDQTSVAKTETSKQAETSRSADPKAKSSAEAGLGFKGDAGASLAASETGTGTTPVAGPPEAGPMFNQTIGKAGPEYTGKKISLDFQDADIKNVLRLIAEVSGFNLITSDDVTGKVTVKLLNVPWDHALDIILKTKGLGQVREGTIIRVAPMAGLTKEKEDEGKRRSAEAAAEPLVTRIVTLNFTRAKDAVPTLTKSLGPRGNMTMDERTNTLVIRDIAMNVEGVAELAKTLDKATPQVQIEARIVEVNTNYARELGVQWGGHYFRHPEYGNAMPYRFPNTLGVQGGMTSIATTSIDGTKGFAVNLPVAESVGALGFSVGSIANIMSLDIKLTAMQTSGKLKVVSNPRVATLDNQEAKIKSGIEIPYPVVDKDGNVTISWAKAILELKVTPHITDERFIDMKISATKDDADWTNAITYVIGVGATTVPAILKKEAQTQLLVKDGDTIVLGGVFSTKEERKQDGLPWLADIPILGWLFKKTAQNQENNELLIFITPKVIKPVTI